MNHSARAPDDDRLDLLIQNYLDAETSPDEEDEFRRRLADPAFRLRVAECATDHVSLYECAQQGLLTASGPNIPPGVGRSLVGRRRVWAMAAALVSTILLGMPLFDWCGQDASPAPIARISRLTGRVLVATDEPWHDVAPGQPIPSGAEIHVHGLFSLALLRFGDGTEIGLTGETRLRCEQAEGQTTLTVLAGQISACVARQPAGRPLLIRTPNAEIEVLGTRLAVSAEADVSELGVQEGLVRFRRLSDGETIDVASGQYAVASPRSRLEARPWPLAPPRWGEDFSEGLPEAWRYGQWVEDGPPGERPGAVRATRRFALDGTTTDHFRITPPKASTRGLFRIEPDSVLTFTYKMEKPGWFQIMFGARSDDLNPAHVGNYEVQSSSWSKAAAGDWNTVRIPLAAFQKAIPGREYGGAEALSPCAGEIVYLLWFSTGEVDRGLVVDKIEIRPSAPKDSL